ncbi:MAG: 4Fe-4S binding protein [Candidatus Aegiribacteria sp.]|nr:4Fe-4S binding protein [Candidatus Aegiribacteria sp.]
MKRITRKIIKIDEDKCDGCGICAEACHEGAIEIIDGKAKLVKESYCDGLGDCIGPCPRNAITIEERTAEEFDEEAVRKYMLERSSCSSSYPGSEPISDNKRNDKNNRFSSSELNSRLSTWPVQISLIPPEAPFLNNSDLLITADCVPLAFADFHREFIGDKVVLIGCAKLDDSKYYEFKLSETFRLNTVNSITVVYMEVPCCRGLPKLVESAIESSGSVIPMESIMIGIKGDILEKNLRKS